ncbi:MAG: hypothetical protein IPL05_06745 [Betaproteobacteria bacterium]|nr:hypothetical protein [Betaproteobacteria bacterium]
MKEADPLRGGYQRPGQIAGHHMCVIDVVHENFTLLRSIITSEPKAFIDAIQPIAWHV